MFYIYRFQTGPLGTLHTKEKYRGEGLATIVVKSIFKQIAELGNDVFACVKQSNAASRAVFEKVGCEIVDEVNWIATANCSEEEINGTTGEQFDYSTLL